MEGAGPIQRDAEHLRAAVLHEAAAEHFLERAIEQEARGDWAAADRLRALAEGQHLSAVQRRQLAGDPSGGFQEG